MEKPETADKPKRKRGRPSRRDVMLETMNAAWLWSESRDVPVEFCRMEDAVTGEASDWRIGLTFRDSAGWYKCWQPVDRFYGLPSSAVENAVRKNLDKACAQARKDRIEELGQRLAGPSRVVSPANAVAAAA